MPQYGYHGGQTSPLPYAVQPNGSVTNLAGGAVRPMNPAVGGGRPQTYGGVRPSTPPMWQRPAQNNTLAGDVGFGVNGIGGGKGGPTPMPDPTQPQQPFGGGYALPGQPPQMGGGYGQAGYGFQFPNMGQVFNQQGSPMQPMQGAQGFQPQGGGWTLNYARQLPTQTYTNVRRTHQTYTY